MSSAEDIRTAANGGIPRIDPPKNPFPAGLRIEVDPVPMRSKVIDRADGVALDYVKRIQFDIDADQRGLSEVTITFCGLSLEASFTDPKIQIDDAGLKIMAKMRGLVVMNRLLASAQIILISALVTVVAVLLSSCAPVQPRTGPVVGTYFPQALEQCQAQPELDWCREPR